jgi:hypothetical protein
MIDIRNTRFKVHVLVLMTVKAGSGMNEDGRNLLHLVSKAKHSFEGAISAVCDFGHGRMGGGRIIAASAHSYVEIMSARSWSIKYLIQILGVVGV